MCLHELVERYNEAVVACFDALDENPDLDPDVYLSHIETCHKDVVREILRRRDCKDS